MLKAAEKAPKKASRTPFLSASPSECSYLEISCGSDETARTASHRDLFWPAAYGTVRCDGDVVAIVWPKEELFGLLDSQPEMRQRMDHVIVETLVRRLLSSRDGANIKDYLRVISQSWAAQEVRKRKIHMMASGVVPEEVHKMASVKDSISGNGRSNGA